MYDHGCLYLSEFGGIEDMASAPARIQEFYPERAIAALMYIVHATDCDMYKALKMMYAADKRHMALTGQTMAGDVYYTLPKGATPTGLYDIIKDVRDSRNHWVLPDAGRFFEVRGNNIIPRMDVPVEFLSPIAIKCLDETVEEYEQHPGWFYWYKRAHDSAYQATQRNAAIPNKDIAKTLGENANAVIEYLENPYPDE